MIEKLDELRERATANTGSCSSEDGRNYERALVNAYPALREQIVKMREACGSCREFLSGMRQPPHRNMVISYDPVGSLIDKIDAALTDSSGTDEKFEAMRRAAQP